MTCFHARSAFLPLHYRAQHQNTGVALYQRSPSVLVHNWVLAGTRNVLIGISVATWTAVLRLPATMDGRRLFTLGKNGYRTSFAAPRSPTVRWYMPPPLVQSDGSHSSLHATPPPLSPPFCTAHRTLARHLCHACIAHCPHQGDQARESHSLYVGARCPTTLISYQQPSLPHCTTAFHAAYRTVHRRALLVQHALLARCICTQAHLAPRTRAGRLPGNFSNNTCGCAAHGQDFFAPYPMPHPSWFSQAGIFGSACYHCHLGLEQQ